MLCCTVNSEFEDQAGGAGAREGERERFLMHIVNN